MHDCIPNRFRGSGSGQRSRVQPNSEAGDPANPGPPEHDRDSLPSHLAQGVRAAANVEEEHERKASRIDRFIDALAASVGRPAVVLLFLAFVIAWIIVNTVLPANQRLDSPPFGVLSTTASVAALAMTIVILTSQRRAARLGDEREQLILQLSIVNEAKNSKIIQLLQELRRDHPELSDRHDPEAAAMTEPANPGVVLANLRRPNESQRQL